MLQFICVCLQDILSSIDPLLPAALVKCLYLLVCLPAKADNGEAEATFQEPLAKVDPSNKAFSPARSSFIQFSHSDRFCSSCADCRSTRSDWWTLRRCSVSSSASRRCGTRPAPSGGGRPPACSRRYPLQRPATPFPACSVT